MGKGTFKGFVPKDDPMFSTGPELFSRPEYKPSSTSSAKSTTGATPAKPSSAEQTEPENPMQPAIDAYEEAGIKMFTDMPKKDQTT